MHRCLSFEKKLVSDGFLRKEIILKAPAKVVYYITENGKTSIPIISMFCHYEFELMEMDGVSD
ncbi:MAG: winged helix-turn-helix transcriptional regulator [Bacteroidota bacterium]